MKYCCSKCGEEVPRSQFYGSNLFYGKSLCRECEPKKHMPGTDVTYYVADRSEKNEGKRNKHEQ
jgi:hypothetical protein